VKTPIPLKKLSTILSQHVTATLNTNKTSTHNNIQIFLQRLKLKFAPNIIRVLLTPEFAASKIAATMLRRSRFLPNKTTHKQHQNQTAHNKNSPKAAITIIPFFKLRETNEKSKLNLKT
jgi:hypothetical protein